MGVKIDPWTSSFFAAAESGDALGRAAKAEGGTVGVNIDPVDSGSAGEIPFGTAPADGSGLLVVTTGAGGSELLVGTAPAGGSLGGTAAVCSFTDGVPSAPGTGAG